MANLGKLAIAMLGVLAYQNRDRIGDMIRRARERDRTIRKVESSINCPKACQALLSATSSNDLEVWARDRR
jgi:hypothetical protein